MSRLQLTTIGIVLGIIVCLALAPGVQAIAALPAPAQQTTPTAAEPDTELQEAVQKAFAEWAQLSGVPYRNVQWFEEENDGYFAWIRIEAEFRTSRSDPWALRPYWMECRRVGETWLCDRPQEPTPTPTPLAPTATPTPALFQYPPANRISVRNADSSYTSLSAYGDSDLATWPVGNLTVIQDKQPTIVVYHSFGTWGIELFQRFPGLGVRFSYSCPIVSEVISASGAETAGIQEGDTILALNDWIYSCDGAWQVLRGYDLGAVINVTVRRGESTHSFPVVLSPILSDQVEVDEESRFVSEAGEAMYLYEIRPIEPLEPGGIYCLEAENIAIGDNSDPKFCFYISSGPTGVLGYGERVDQENMTWPSDRWMFSGKQGDIVTILMTSEEIDTYLELHDAHGNLLAQDDDSAGNGDSLIAAYSLPAMGDYTVVAKGYSGQTGPYSLEIVRGVSQGELGYGESRSGSITGVATDLWQFSGESGNIVTIVAASDSFSPRLELRNSANEDIASGDGVIRFRPLSATDAYSIVIYAAGGGEGDYALSLFSLDAMSQDAKGEISYGDAIEETLADIVGDRWTFTGNEGDLVTISMLSESYDAFLELYDPESHLVVDDDDGGRGANPLIRFFELPVAGLYTVVARPLGEGQGDYSLSLRKLDDMTDNPNGRLEYGERVKESMNDPAGERWVFTGAEGDIVTVMMSEATFDGFILLYAPDNARVAEGNRLIRFFELPIAGDYTLLVNGDFEGTGQYTLSLRGLRNIAEDAKGGLAYGDYVDETLADVAGDRWTFHGEAGDEIIIAANGSGFPVYVELYDPESSSIAQGDWNGNFTAELPISGDYTALVSGQDDATSPYILMLDTAEHVGANFRGLMSYGNELNENLSDPTGDRWRFVGREGDRVSLSMNSENMDSYLELRDAEGNWLAENDDDGGNSNALIASYVLPTSDLYTVVARSYGESTGDYTLRLMLEGAVSAERGDLSYDNRVAAVIDNWPGHRWTFAGEAGDTVAIEMKSESMDALLDLYDPDGDRVASDDDSGGNGDARIIYALPTSGAYTIIARGFLGATNDYTLSLTTVDGEVPAASEPAIGEELLTNRLQKLKEHIGVEFVHVPAGEFIMGSSEEEVTAVVEECTVLELDEGLCDELARLLLASETPRHQIELDEFWVGKTEVTNAQYRAFVEADGYRQRDLWTGAGWDWLQEQGIIQPIAWSQLDSVGLVQPDQPVFLGWYEAHAYARWLARETGLDIRLPTEAQWEKAARGAEGRAWPWGDDSPVGSRLNSCDVNCPDEFSREGWRDNATDDGYAFTAPVGSYPDGASPYGALDMAGNMAEWTSTLWGGCNFEAPGLPYPYQAGDGREEIDISDTSLDACRVMRSGGFLFPTILNYPAFRMPMSPGRPEFPAGFRLVVGD